MKKEQKILVFVILFFLILLTLSVFQLKKSVVLEESIHKTINEGIQFSKKTKFSEAHRSFDHAHELLLNQGFLFHENDFFNFSSLLNEFKQNKTKRFNHLFQLLPDNVKTKILQLKHSSEINDSLRKNFSKAMNKLLLRIDLIKILNINLSQDVSTALLNLIKKTENNNVPFLFDFIKYKNEYLNRMILFEFYTPYFPKPVSLFEIKMNQAIAFHYEKKFEQSSQILGDLISLKPDYVKLYILSARNLEQSGELKKSIEILKTAMDRINDDEELLTEIAFLYFRAGKKNLAQGFLERAIEINPKYNYAISGLKIVERKNKADLKPSAHYKVLKQESPDNLYVISNLASSLLNENRILESDKIISQGLNLFPEDAYLLKLKSKIEGGRSNFKNALKCLFKAEKYSKKSDPEIIILIAITYFNQFQTQKAYEKISEGLKKFPQNPYIILNAAFICESIPEKRHESTKYYKKYLTINPLAKNKIRVLKKIKTLTENLVN